MQHHRGGTHPRPDPPARSTHPHAFPPELVDEGLQLRVHEGRDHHGGALAVQLAGLVVGGAVADEPPVCVCVCVCVRGGVLVARAFS